MARDLSSKGLGRPQKSLKRYVDKLHYHGCTRCRRKYGCSCSEPETNGICNDCRQGRDTFIMAGVGARPCCARRRPASRDEQDRYSLAGDDPWWICPHCARCFTRAGAES